MELKENLDTLFDRLEKFFRTETVIGNPINVGEVTLVPIIEVGFGMGSGGGSGKDGKGNDGTGGGTGVGAKISPNSILVIKGGEVSLITLKDKGSLEKVLAMVPDIVNQIKDKSEENEE
ncbi:GerW family sporulation protein [Dehalobacterium formicoaceticum]|uniref:Spore germination protein GerW family protein n=1 Tax=Dehalobacterium formicoaceticum TaxID=51515 RepID=A0ABT1Y5B9_9FIRM|nr:spore germination protein GerW family protein [Dehalobacterium formicoaceticum]MCR6546065.1 spore germination protein GerW family protein [Dehalobacterium formicoaceticum]